MFSIRVPHIVLMQIFTPTGLKYLLITLTIACLSSTAFGYELNKNIVYYKGFIEGYLHEEKGDWSIICELENNDRCLLTQFIEIKKEEAERTFLVFIIKEKGENYLGLRTKLDDKSELPNKSYETVMALSNINNIKFQLLNPRCTENFCEFIGVIPEEFQKKLQNEDDFIIGLGNKNTNANFGIMIEMNGFNEMFAALYEN